MNWAYSIGTPFKVLSTVSKTVPQIIFSCIAERNAVSRIGQNLTRQIGHVMEQSQLKNTGQTTTAASALAQ